MTQSLLDRLDAKSEVSGDCRLWLGRRMPNGYGALSWHGKSWLVHRAIWTATRGPIPDGLTIDHLCRVRNCINVAHMEVVTLAENSRRGGGLEVAWERYRARTHCKHGHEFTPENTYIRKGDGARICRVCARAGWRAYRARISPTPRPRELRPCGTQAGYERHRKAGEVCQPCRDAKAAHERARRAAKRGGAS